MILSVVTPDKSIAQGKEVEMIVVPGSLGQMTILPGHIGLLSSLVPGSFAYKVSGEWTWAFLSGGFVQVNNDKVNVLAETMEFASEVDMAAAEIHARELTEKLKATKFDSPNYFKVAQEQAFAEKRLAALKQIK